MAGIGDAVALLFGGNLVVEVIILAAKVGIIASMSADLPASFLEPKAVKS